MKIMFTYILYFYINEVYADYESYEDDLEEITKANKLAKRCGPEYLAEDESSGCPSSEDTTVKAVPIMTVATTTTKTIIIPNGPLFDFIINICDSLLNKFSHYRISKYFNVLSKSLRGLGSGRLMKMIINRFCGKLKKLSDFNGMKLKAKVVKLLTILTEGNPILNEFFFAANRIYKIWDDNEMDDYIYLLRQYGQGKTSHIGQKTHEIFQQLVFYRLSKQKDSKRSDIELKFKLAVIEYHDEI